MKMVFGSFLILILGSSSFGATTPSLKEDLNNRLNRIQSMVAMNEISANNAFVFEDELRTLTTKVPPGDALDKVQKMLTDLQTRYPDQTEVGALSKANDCDNAIATRTYHENCIAVALSRLVFIKDDLAKQLQTQDADSYKNELQLLDFAVEANHGQLGYKGYLTAKLMVKTESFVVNHSQPDTGSPQTPAARAVAK